MKVEIDAELMAQLIEVVAKFREDLPLSEEAINGKVWHSYDLLAVMDKIVDSLE